MDISTLRRQARPRSTMETSIVDPTTQAPSSVNAAIMAQMERANQAPQVGQAPAISIPSATKESPINNELEQEGIGTSVNLQPFQSYEDLVPEDEEASIRARETERLAQMRALIGSEYDELIGQRQERGEKQLGGAEARLGITRGLGASSSRMQFMQEMQGQIDQDINTLTEKKAQAMAELDFEMADRVQEQIRELEDTRFKAQQVAFNQGLNLLQEERMQAGEQRSQARFGMEQVEFEQEQQEKEIETVAGSLSTVLGANNEENVRLIQEEAQARGLDPNALMNEINRIKTEEQEQIFDRGKEIFNIAKQLPEGQSVEIAPGIVVEGIKQEDPDIVSVTRTIGNTQYRQEYMRDPETMELQPIGEPISLGPRWKAGGGGETSTSGLSKLRTLAEAERDDIISGKTGFTEAYNRMMAIAKDKGVQVTSQDLNLLLGGEIPYDEESGVWDAASATGLANEEEVMRRRKMKWKSTTEDEEEEGGLISKRVE